MPTIKLQRDGLIIEAEVAFDEFKELAGLKPEVKTWVPPATAPSRPVSDFEGFMNGISDRGRLSLRHCNRIQMGLMDTLSLVRLAMLIHVKSEDSRAVD